MANYVKNYRQITRGIFKVFCREKCISEPKLVIPEIHEEIQSKFKISGKKISKFLKPYEIENGKFYRNPFIYELFLKLEDLICDGMIPPTSIGDNEDLQREFGKTPDELSMIIQRKYNKEIPPDVIKSWVKRYYADRIKKGVNDHFYLSPW